MPITGSPFKLKDLDLVLVAAGGDLTAADSYRCQLSQAQLSPSAAGGGGGDLETFCTTHSDSGGAATWELQLAGFQAYADAADLSLLCFDHEQEDFDFLLMPRGGTVSATNPGFRGTVTLTPTSIGGTANEWARFSANLPCKQKPTKITAPLALFDA